MIRQTLQSLYQLYSWHMPRTMLVAFREHHSSPAKFLRWFWTAKTHRTSHNMLYSLDAPLVWLLRAGMFGMIFSGVWLLYWWAWHGHAGYWAIGLALLLSYPFVVAHLIAGLFLLKWLVWSLFHPKQAGKAVVSRILEAQVKALRRRHEFKIVAVAGSVGKTSTKLAVANLLGQTLRVRHQAGNYNDRITVPLVFFDQVEPRVWNVLAWCKIFGENLAMTSQPYPYDVVVLELGTDGPGQLEKFAYLKPDITVLTAIAPEHMAFFKTLDAVAREELTVFDYSKRVLVNGDDIAAKYMAGRKFEEYSLITNVAHNYYARPTGGDLSGQQLNIDFPSGKLISHVHYVGHQGAKFAVAAAAVADMLSVPHKDIELGLQRLQSFAGRMQILEGVKNSTLIDDTYNASPLAVKAALDVLYAHKAPQRIAILGSMNELGDFAHEAHKEIGKYCDPKKLDMVVTIGHDAGRWLAPAAERAGCVTHSFKSPYQAGHFVSQQVKKGAVILAKGSQNGVFAEEALKDLLAHPADAEKLVRQNASWLRAKAKQFSS